MMDENKVNKNVKISRSDTLDRPIEPDIYPEIDTDLARDNLEIDLPAADQQDLY